jgi:hypothetical protein
VSSGAHARSARPFAERRPSAGNWPRRPARPSTCEGVNAGTCVIPCQGRGRPVQLSAGRQYRACAQHASSPGGVPRRLLDAWATPSQVAPGPGQPRGRGRPARPRRPCAGWSGPGEHDAGADAVGERHRPAPDRRILLVANQTRVGEQIPGEHLVVATGPHVGDVACGHGANPPWSWGPGVCLAAGPLAYGAGRSRRTAGPPPLLPTPGGCWRHRQAHRETTSEAVSLLRGGGSPIPAGAEVVGAHQGERAPYPWLTIWIRLPQVSSNTAVVAGPAWTGSWVNRTPRP